jgi:hypothetical protein
LVCGETILKGSRGQNDHGNGSNWAHRKEDRRGIAGQFASKHSEATRILGKRIGKPDRQYVQFSYADQADALVQAGLSKSFTDLYVEMTRAFNEGIIKPLRASENTTPTQFEDFADELAWAYDSV